jgi:CRP-like cAMP-binding protein
MGPSKLPDWRPEGATAGRSRRAPARGTGPGQIPEVVAAASGGVPVRGNLLLLGLPAADTERLAAQAHRVRLDRKATLMTPGSPINSVYFPETGALSEFVLMADGSAVEVGFIGREGMAGWPAVFGSHVSGIWVVCQTGGLFLQFATTELAAEVDRNPELHRRLHHHAAAVIGQRAISAACDRHHDVVARAARHLLAARDLGLDDELVVTHEFLALRLGVQRPTVTVALAELERLGAITHGRGHVTVVDRAGLEQITCECYWAMRREIGRHLDWLPPSLGAWFSDASGDA